MAGSQSWRTRPVFITSTFRDMHAERDYLHAVVLPELQERLRERRHYLEAIDLRVGVGTISVDDERAKEVLVLKVCLGEIERSRPFLVALLGDRYGWVPPAERMVAAATEAGFHAEVAGKSITALEIEYGVLDAADQRRRSHFYFRDPLPYDEMSPDLTAVFREEDPDAAERLAELKRSIEREMPDRVHRYRVTWDARAARVKGLEDFGRQVLEDLWHDLDEETRAFAHAPLPTWQEGERWALDEFIDSRARDFVGREDITDELLALASSPVELGAAWGACVTGGAGSGKSAVFAHLCRVFADEDVLVLAHAAGVSVRSTSADMMLRRWVQELADALGSADPLADAATAEEVDSTFADLLSRAAMQRRVVVLIDALNQFEPSARAQYLTWLPKQWPGNARLIATTIPGVPSQSLAQRAGVEIRALRPLNEAEADKIALSVYARYHRQPDGQVLRVLLGKTGCGSPLWLELALEEMNLLDEDDFDLADRQFSGTPEQRLQQLQIRTAERLPGDVEGLYGWMLDRAEKVWGEKQARAFAETIALSRSGWREQDLQALMPAVAGQGWDPLRFAGLRRSFRAHIVRRGSQGQWGFHHNQMRQAILRRNLADPARVRQLHGVVAEHVGGLPREDPLRQGELMYHLVGADDRRRAASLYADPGLTEAEVAGATQALAAHILATEDQDPNPGLGWVVSLLDDCEPAVMERDQLSDRLMFDLDRGLEGEVVLRTRQLLLEAVRVRLSRLAQADPGNTRLRRDLSASHNKIGDLLRTQGSLAGALEAYQVALGLAEGLARSDPGDAGWQRDLSVSQERIGNALLAQGDLQGALEVYRAVLAIRERLARSDASNALLQDDVCLGRRHLGEVLEAQGNLRGALKAYRGVLAIAERLAQADPTDGARGARLCGSHEMVGDNLMAQGDVAGALEAYRAAVAVAERVVRADPGSGERQCDLAGGRLRMGDALLAQGDMGGAVEAYRAAQAVLERLRGWDPSNTRWQRDLSVAQNKIGDALRAQGDPGGALEAYQAALEIADRLARSDPGHAGWQRDLSVCQNRAGDALLEQGDAAGGLEAHRAALEIADRLARSDPSNAGWQRDLWVSLYKAAAATEKTGQPGADAFRRRALDVLLGMERAGMYMSQQEKGFLRQLKKKPRQ